MLAAFRAPSPHAADINPAEVGNGRSTIDFSGYTDGGSADELLRYGTMDGLSAVCADCSPDDDKFRHHGRVSTVQILLGSLDSPEEFVSREVTELEGVVEGSMLNLMAYAHDRPVQSPHGEDQ